MTEFPLTGQIWRADYGEFVAEHDYRVAGKLSFPLPTDGSIMTVDLMVTQLRDDLFLLRFEDGGYASIVAIEDLATHTINATMFVHHDNSMVNMTGKLTRVDD